MKELVKISSLRPFTDTEGLNQDDEVLRKRFSSKVTISPDEERTCVATISTTDEDADLDVIIPTGADLKRFTKNPVVLWAHDYSSMPIAKITALSVTEDSIVAKMQFADTPMALECWSLVKDGYINTCSIGFIVKERFHKGTDEFKSYLKESKRKVADTVERIISKFELIENSLVPVPSNPNALIQAISSKSITLSDKTIKELDLPKVIIVKTEPIAEPKVEVKVEVPDKVLEVEKTVKIEEKPLSVTSKYIKVIRHGAVDVSKLVELRKMAKLGKIV